MLSYHLPPPARNRYPRDRPGIFPCIFVTTIHVTTTTENTSATALTTSLPSACETSKGHGGADEGRRDADEVVVAAREEDWGRNARREGEGRGKDEAGTEEEGDASVGNVSISAFC